MSIIYLYIKQHSITGLKYFGMTRKNPFKYHGSGIHWQRHIKKHGKQFINTIEVWGFDDIELCSEFALSFSEENDIVESLGWANKIPENAKDGAPTGKYHHLNFLPNPMQGKKHSEESKLKMAKAREGIKLGPQSEATKQKRSLALKGRPNPRKGLPVSDAQRVRLQALAESRKGIPRDEATVQKMSENRKGKNTGPQSKEHIEKRIAKRMETIAKKKLSLL